MEENGYNTTATLSEIILCTIKLININSYMWNRYVHGEALYVVYDLILELYQCIFCQGYFKQIILYQFIQKTNEMDQRVTG